MFIKHRKKFFALSVAVIIIGIVLCIVRGIELDIEFKGGSVVEYSYTGEIDEKIADDIITEALGQQITVQRTKNIADDSTKLIVNVAGNEALSTEQRMAMTQALEKQWPGQNWEIASSQLINPVIGHEMLRNGILAMIIASVLIIAYVWFSFRQMSGPSAGVMALVALFHDITIASIAFVLTGSAINETLIAVILTILGFSINDTIVVYDRIRENLSLPDNDGKPFEEVVEMSIRQSLTRTINTSLCMFIAVLIAYIFAIAYGLESIKEFALPILVGIISGTYSSIFIASPLWVSWKTRGGRSGYES